MVGRQATQVCNVRECQAQRLLRQRGDAPIGGWSISVLVGCWWAIHLSPTLQAALNAAGHAHASVLPHGLVGRAQRHALSADLHAQRHIAQTRCHVLMAQQCCGVPVRHVVRRKLGLVPLEAVGELQQILWAIEYRCWSPQAGQAGRAQRSEAG